MRIPCPACGERSVDEFAYLGDADVSRPGPDADVGAFVDYVYLRENPTGPHRELWHHASGCHAWLVVERDLKNHAVTSVSLARDVAATRRLEAA